MIEPVIPAYIGQYVTFSDTLPADDSTEALAITAPDGTVTDVPHSSLTKLVNADTTVTYSYQQQVTSSGRWVGQFSSSGAEAGSTAPILEYVI